MFSGIVEEQLFTIDLVDGAGVLLRPDRPPFMTVFPRGARTGILEKCKLRFRAGLTTSAVAQVHAFDFVGYIHLDQSQ